MLPGPIDSIDLATVRRVLVVKLRHHGDVLLTSPVFSALKSRAPYVRIDALVYSDTRDMLSLHPAIDQIHCVDRRWKSLGLPARLGHELRLLRQLRAGRYDLLIHLTEHPRGAWLARLLGCRFSVAPGYSGRSRFWRHSFTHRTALPKNALRHMVEWNLDALRRIGLQPRDEDKHLVLIPGDEAASVVEEVLRSNRLTEGKYFHVHPTSRWPFKCWPAERMAKLLDALIERGDRIVLTASPADEEKRSVGAIMSLMKHGDAVVDLSGRLSLKELAELCSRARLFVGVDSAPMHIAASMGTPTIALFGPSGDAEWGPWQVPHRVVSSTRHRCRPCGIDGCGGGKVSDCLVTLPESEMLAAIDELLQETKARTSGP